MNLSNEGAVRREDVYSIEAFCTPSGGRPDIAIDIAADAIGYPGDIFAKVRPLPAGRHPHVIDQNRTRIAGALGVRYRRCKAISRQGRSTGRWALAISPTTTVATRVFGSSR